MYDNLTFFCRPYEYLPGGTDMVGSDYTFLVIGKTMTLIFGLLISALSFLSYRRHKDRLMLEISIGFLFISIGSFIEGVMYEILGLNIYLDHLIESIFILIGMIIIAFTLFIGGDE